MTSVGCSAAVEAAIIVSRDFLFNGRTAAAAVVISAYASKVERFEF